MLGIEGERVLDKHPASQDDAVLRRATAADKPAILDLINLVQPNLPWSPAHFDWQLLQGPGGPAEMRVIEADGRIASLYVGTRKRLWFDGAVKNAVMVQDVLTDPAFRGRGFLNRCATAFLAEMQARGDLGYTFPNKLSENSFRRSGWTELCRIPILVKPLAHAPATTSGLLREVPAFNDAVTAIWEESGLGIGAMRDRAYLDWRYGRPNTVYRRFMIGDDAGYCVLKRYDRAGGAVVHVCDLVLRQDQRGMLERVLATIDGLALEASAVELTAWVTEGHPYRAGYDASGFRRDESNDRFSFVAGPDADLARLATAAAWHLSQGDSDVY